VPEGQRVPTTRAVKQAPRARVTQRTARVQVADKGAQRGGVRGAQRPSAAGRQVGVQRLQRAARGRRAPQQHRRAGGRTGRGGCRKEALQRGVCQRVRCQVAWGEQLIQEHLRPTCALLVQMRCAQDWD